MYVSGRCSIDKSTDGDQGVASTIEYHPYETGGFFGDGIGIKVLEKIVNMGKGGYYRRMVAVCY